MAAASSELATLGDSTSATQVVTKTFIILFEKITGTKYSQAERDQLNEFKRLYKSYVDINGTPKNWELDKDFKPVEAIDNTKWIRLTDDLIYDKGDNLNFRHQSIRIAKIAATHLSNRNGTRGDLESQFFAEWVHFALNLLTSYTYTQVDKIKARIKYLEAVFDHEQLLTGFFSNNVEARIALAKIQKQLEACLEIAPYEELRECARDSFSRCRNITTALLMACAEALYYARDTKTYHESLDLSEYVQPESKAVVGISATLYPELKETHTGRMLYEVIVLGKLNSFGEPNRETKDDEQSFTYFDKDLKLRTVDWSLNEKTGLPAWVAKSDVQTQLQHIQKFCQSMLLLIKVKSLIDTVYELSGTGGDLWAFADQQGKKSIEALLDFFEIELDGLFTNLNYIFDYNKEQKKALVLRGKMNVKNDGNLNYNAAKRAYDEVDKHYNTLKDTIKRLRNKMRDFPVDAQEQFAQKKRFFYQSLVSYIGDHHQTKLGSYQQLIEANETPETRMVVYQKPPEQKIPAEAMSTDTQVVSLKALLNQKKRSVEINFKFPLKLMSGKRGENDYWWPVSEHFKLKADNSTDANGWILGFGYEYWIKGFFTRNEKMFTDYNQLAQTLENKLHTSIMHEEISIALSQLANALQKIIEKISKEKPTWRLKLGLWPIQTKGWPFNDGAMQFADSLILTLQTILRNARAATTEALQKIGQEHGELIVRVHGLEKQLSVAKTEIKTLQSIQDTSTLNFTILKPSASIGDSKRNLLLPPPSQITSVAGDQFPPGFFTDIVAAGPKKKK